jgi:hypothetical protein
VRDGMVSRKELLRRGKRAFDKLTGITPTNEEIRKLLPLSRGGKPRSKVTSAPSRDPTPLPKTVLPTLAGDSPGNIARAFQQSAQFRQQRVQPMQVIEEVNDMNTQDIVREVVNDPMIKITPDMLPIINDPAILMDLAGNLIQNQFSQAALLREPAKKKRKVSKYQKELGRQLKLLKKKHPRTPISSLMKRAHRATRKALK